MLSKSSKLSMGLIAISVLAILMVFLTKESPTTSKIEEGAIEKIASTKVDAKSETSSKKAKSSSGFSLENAMKDRIIGNKDAPITINEFASLTCPHCAAFAKEGLPEVKSKLLDTGKAKLVFTDFPLDGFALKASMMARCLPEDKYFNMIEVLFNNQKRWTSAKNPVKALSRLGALAGMTQKSFDKCIGNKELENAIVKKMKDSQVKYHLQATPSFVFNDGAKLMTGARGIEEFELAVKELTK